MSPPGEVAATPTLAGFYYDAARGGCLRRVRKLSRDQYNVTGATSDEAPPWSGTLRVLARKGDERWMLQLERPASFHPRLVRGQWQPRARCVRWEDGATWHKMFVHPHQLR
jgi:hypothetical protein